jgi:isopentenyl-diphosphate delta-isomerase type 1
MPDDIIDICDEQNKITGKRTTTIHAHDTGLWHRASHIWIYNAKGEILLQLRAKDKRMYPSVWDISAAGHVSAGEEPMETALRELEEELSIKARQSDMHFSKIKKVSIVFNKLRNNEFYYVYFLRFDGDIKKLRLQEDEVQAIRFVSIKDLKKELKNNPEKFVPHGKYWDEVMEEVKRLRQ